MAQVDAIYGWTFKKGEIIMAERTHMTRRRVIDVLRRLGGLSKGNKVSDGIKSPSSTKTGKGGRMKKMGNPHSKYY
jgi:hypothetical protein